MKTRGKLVLTKTGRKGFIYNDNPTHNDKLKVYLVDNTFQETGEKLLCDVGSLQLIGFKD